MALGLGFWARARGDAGVATLAFGAGLLHAWNHAAMKGLLFLGAGSLLHGAGTRDLERLGGLLRRMPWTGGAMVVGAVAIAALPPLNGFSGEWLLFGALIRVGTSGSATANLAAIVGVAALALVGGLAALCFARLLGVALLGVPRGDGAARAHESPLAMTVPVVILAVACVAGALGAPALVGLHSALLAELSGAGAGEVAAAASHLGPTALFDAALLVGIGLAAAVLLARVRRAARAETWGCGYAAPTARMQYTAASFSELLGASVLPRWIRPRLRVRRPVGPLGPFPSSARFESDAADPLTRGVYEPFLVSWAGRFARLRFLQQGNVHVYLLYVLATAVAGLAWVAARDGWAP
jgi:NADH:ubiquinone oxidoreductase subunit 5 (subunit L)/multisubunit Na+/H+ antiporter MnhA subunit